MTQSCQNGPSAVNSTSQQQYRLSHVTTSRFDAVLKPQNLPNHSILTRPVQTRRVLHNSSILAGSRARVATSHPTLFAVSTSMSRSGSRQAVRHWLIDQRLLVRIHHQQKLISVVHLLSRFTQPFGKNKYPLSMAGVRYIELVLKIRVYILHILR